MSLDKNNLPTEEGIYSVKNLFGSGGEIDVYLDPTNHHSVWIEDYRGETQHGGIDDSTDCHVPVQNTELGFIAKVGELK